MNVVNGVLRLRYEELAHRGGRLGRHLELDARSLAHTVEREFADRAVAIRPAAHPPSIGILDQGAVGSCTGNAGTYKLSAEAGASGLAGLRLDGLGLGLAPADEPANERFALALYHEATINDGFDGTYPPDDTGSSGLGVCRALKAAGLISSYAWATTVRGLGVLMQTGGVMAGVPWLRAFSEPDSGGFIDSNPLWAQSGVVGGHELYWATLERWDDRDLSKCVVAFPNSWGTSWGDAGWGRLRLSTYRALRQQIDIKSFRLAA